MNIAVQQFRWGVNVDVGYTGLVVTKDNAISAGIRWFEEGWDEKFTRKLVPSHAFTITGPNDTIEAFSNGVHDGTLTAYLDDPDCALLVRRPHLWTPAMGARIVAEAEKYVGDGYGYPLIAGMLISRSAFGTLLDAITHGWFGRTVDAACNQKHREICSEEVALTMRAQPEVAGLGIAGLPPYTVNPEMIFLDQYCYEPSDYACELLK